MLTSMISARPRARLVAALGAVLAVAACGSMEVGSVPQCSALQPNCSSFGPAAAPSSPVTAAAPMPASGTGATGAPLLSQ